ncbi:MAG: DUF3465 domain-containing protein [Pseudomonadota bacterium]
MKIPHTCNLLVVVFLSLIIQAGLAQVHTAASSAPSDVAFLIADDLEAQLSVDERSIFQKAEVLYPGLFGNASEFRTIQGYTYKFYAAQNTYIGMRDNLVYVLGGPFGNAIVNQGTVATTLAFLTNVENTRLSAVFDPVFANAWQKQIGNLQAEGTGLVSRILADDITGDAHQRFIVRLRSGQTLLVAHNIDLAPRVPSLKVGDEVAFYGEYEWSAEGGVMHWTHHDPDGKHIAGWIKYKGVTYQ